MILKIPLKITIYFGRLRRPCVKPNEVKPMAIALSFEKRWKYERERKIFHMIENNFSTSYMQRS